jgi:GTPase SAR1 family protein
VFTVEYDNLRIDDYLKADILLLCFNINSPDTLGSIAKKWAPEARCYCPEGIILFEHITVINSYFFNSADYFGW